MILRTSWLSAVSNISSIYFIFYLILWHFICMPPIPKGSGRLNNYDLKLSVYICISLGTYKSSNLQILFLIFCLGKQPLAWKRILMIGIMQKSHSRKSCCGFFYHSDFPFFIFVQTMGENNCANNCMWLCLLLNISEIHKWNRYRINSIDMIIIFM